jgi:hypothetical protein
MKPTPKPIAFVSVDIEATGPNPDLKHSIISIGCSVLTVDGGTAYDKEFFCDLLGAWWSDDTLKWWQQNTKAYEENMKLVNELGVSKEKMAEQISSYLNDLRQKFHLIFVAQPTAYENAYLIKWFGDINPFPKREWIDLYSFFAAFELVSTGSIDFNRKLYSTMKKFYKPTIRHMAFYDAESQKNIFGAVFHDLRELHTKLNALKDFVK